MLRLFAIAALLLPVSHSQIRSQANTSGGFGEDARLQCQLSGAEGVEQVIWQLILPNNTRQKVASYSQKYGEKVHPAFQKKVVFTDTSLSSSSITVKNLTWSDECCYDCWFNIFPEGSKRGRTCLSVEGISDVAVAAEVLPGAGSRSLALRCSATGKPRPELQWDVSPDPGSVEDQSQARSHRDGTWTISSSFTLEVPRDWAGQVECVVNRGRRGEQRRKVPLPQTPEEENRPEDGAGEGEEQETKIARVGLILSAAVLVVLLAGVVLRWLVRSNMEPRPAALEQGDTSAAIQLFQPWRREESRGGEKVRSTADV